MAFLLTLQAVSSSLEFFRWVVWVAEGHMLQLLPDSVWKLLQLLCNWVAESHMLRLLPDSVWKMLRLLCDWAAESHISRLLPDSCRKIILIESFELAAKSLNGGKSIWIFQNVNIWDK